MRTFLRAAAVLVALALLVVLGGLAFLAANKPRMRPASAEKFEPTPARLARGRYLVEHVSDCLGCHSDHDASKFGFPVKPGTEGQGGFAFDARFGVPGLVCAQNITPDRETGLGSWTDGEVLRALREGVDRSGNALFPMMPYLDYHEMSDEDARAIVVALRALSPVSHTAPARKLDFPVSFLVKWAPAPVEGPIATPDPARDHVAYGKYLVTIAGCRDCHTPHDAHGELIAGKEFQGGWEMLGPWGRVVTANLTPHPRVFMGSASKEAFTGVFHAFAPIATAATAPAAPKGRNTVMPWLAMSGMTEADLGAIYDYLKTLPEGGGPVTTFPDDREPPLPPGASPVNVARPDVAR